MHKACSLIVLTAVAVLSAPMIKGADAAARHARTNASVSPSQSQRACLDFIEKCFGVCANNASNDDLDDCVRICGAVNKACKAAVSWWTGEDERAAAHGVIGGGVKDPSAPGSKLKAGGRSTHSGAATATMPGAVSPAKALAATNNGAISTKGASVSHSGAMPVQRGSVAGRPAGGAATSTFRPQ